MCYFTEPMNGYFVHLSFKKKGEWQTKKFRGNKLVRTAFGSTFDQAMIGTTMDGPEPVSDERSAENLALTSALRGRIRWTQPIPLMFQGGGHAPL
jgi:hypothetical protein